MSINWFFYVFIVVYFFVNLYVFSHFWHIRFRNQKSSLFRVILFVVILLLPLHLSIEKFLNISIVPLKITAYLYFVIMFYSALYLLVLDTLKIVLVMLRMSNLYVRNYSHFISFALVLALATTAFGIYQGGQIRAVHYTIDVPRNQSDLTALKLAVFSDVHLSDISGRDFVKKIVQEVNAHDVDLVLIPGDIIDFRVDDLRYDFASDFRQIKSRFGVFAATGNHDYKDDIKLVRAFCKKAQITILEDSGFKIGKSLVVVGRRDRSYAADREGRKPLFDIMETVDKTLPVILMDHTPFNLEQASANGVSLQLSGFTHHGQIFPLQYIMSLMYDLSRGHRVINGTDIIVTSGIGFWGPPVRTSAVPEIAIVQIQLK